MTVDRGIRVPASVWMFGLLMAGAVIGRALAKERVAVSRLLDRDAIEEWRMLALLDNRLTADSELGIYEVITSSVATALQLSAVELAIKEGTDVSVVATSGRPRPNPLIVPLRHREERIGELRLTLKPSLGSGETPKRVVLDQVTFCVAALVYDVVRDVELARARRDADVASERVSRLGQDLHDELAPLLVGTGLAAEALRLGMVPGSPDEISAAKLADRLRAGGAQVRRLSHDLQVERPHGPPLGDALRQHIATLTGPGIPHFSVFVDESILPAEVEQTIYLVALEAMNNILKHARARHAAVRIERPNQDCVLKVIDDGTGIPHPYVSGVGMRSMQHRIDLLGGTLTVVGGDGYVWSRGTVLTAHIPLPRERASGGATERRDVTQT